MRRSTRAIIGTGTIARVAAKSTIITARRVEKTERSRLAGCPQGASLASPMQGEPEEWHHKQHLFFQHTTVRPHTSPQALSPRNIRYGIISSVPIFSL